MSSDRTSDVIDKVERKAEEATRAARDLVDRTTERAGAAYATTRDFMEAADFFVRDRPYASVALAALAGFIVGGLCLGRNPRVVYVKPWD